MAVTAGLVRRERRGEPLLDTLYRGEPLLAAVGVLLVLSMLPTGLALALDGRTLNGVSVWAKPLKFEASMALQLFTMAWLLNLMPEAERASRIVRALSVAMVAAVLFEIAYIALQAARGEASHYNVATPFARAMYQLMAVGAVIIVATGAALGGLILRAGDRRDPMVLAAGLGLLLSGALGLLTGVALGANQSHWVAAPPTDADGLPMFGWSRTGGDLRVAHFAGLHMAQALPLAALAMRGRLPAHQQKAGVVAVAILGVALTFAVWLQARLGLPLVPLA